MKTLISIVGPTASGKTGTAVRLARHLQTEVISADSRQVFRKLSIGTAKATNDEMQGIKHHLLDIAEPTESINAGVFSVRANEIIDLLFATHSEVIMAGGSGLYLNAVWNGLDDIPEVSDEIRAKVNEDLETQGLEFLLQELLINDPVLYARIDRKNPRRVVRGVEVFRATGQPLSSFQIGKTSIAKSYKDVIIGLNPGRAELNQMIDKRVDQMMNLGLLQEVKSIGDEIGFEWQSLQTVGYAELIRHLKGEISLDEAVELIKRNTRNFAKRQMTWFQKNPKVTWFHPAEWDSIFEHVKREIGVS